MHTKWRGENIKCDDVLHQLHAFTYIWKGKNSRKKKKQQQPKKDIPSPTNTPFLKTSSLKCN